MTQRILLSAARVSISRPGYDVVSPPAFTSDYLSIDSGFPQATRLYQSGTRLGLSITSFFNSPVAFGTTFSSYPFVMVMPFDPGNPSVLHGLYMKFVAGTPDVYSNPYQVQIFKDRFRIGPATNDASYNSVSRDWIYFVFAP